MGSSQRRLIGADECPVRSVWLRQNLKLRHHHDHASTAHLSRVDSGNAESPGIRPQTRRTARRAPREGARALLLCGLRSFVEPIVERETGGMGETAAGSLLGYVLLGPDNDSYMLCGPTPHGTCTGCGWAIDRDWVDPAFRLTRDRYDISETWDLYTIVSDDFRHAAGDRGAVHPTSLTAGVPLAASR